jgi:hypothetical protein
LSGPTPYPSPAVEAPVGAAEPDGPKRNNRLARFFARLGWLAAVVVLSLGTAGLVGGMSQPPVSGERPELTWAADQAVAPGLSSASSDLSLLSGEVDQLGALGRTAFQELIDRDNSHLTATIAAGTALTQKIGQDSAAIRVKLAGLPVIGTGDETMIGADLRQRYDAITVALSATAGLQSSWLGLTNGAASATALIGDLADHDTVAAQAVKLGSTGQYTKALATMDKAETSLGLAATRRDALESTVDVTVLTEWIDRNSAFDTAAIHLYQLLAASPHKITPAIRAAFASLTTAKDNLPPDTKGLELILEDLARGGLSQAVIQIENSKASLANAVALIAGMASQP